MILGPDGQPYQASDLTDPRLRSMAGPYRPAESADHATGLTPVRLAHLLRGAETGDPEPSLDLAERIEERWAHYTAVLGVRRRQVSQLALTVEPADDSSDAERAAAIVRDWLRTIPPAQVPPDKWGLGGLGVRCAEGFAAGRPRSRALA